MKTIQAVIQPTKLDAVREALGQVEVTRMTVTDAQDFGTPENPHEQGGKPYRKTVLTVVVNDDFLERTLDIIAEAAKTGIEGNFGDGIALVVPTERAIRISDGVTGPGAV